jgi:hypothetical protein
VETGNGTTLPFFVHTESSVPLIAACNIVSVALDDGGLSDHALSLLPTSYLARHKPSGRIQDLRLFRVHSCPTCYGLVRIGHPRTPVRDSLIRPAGSPDRRDFSVRHYTRSKVANRQRFIVERTKFGGSRIRGLKQTETRCSAISEECQVRKSGRPRDCNLNSSMRFLAHCKPRLLPETGWRK